METEREKGLKAIKGLKELYHEDLELPEISIPYRIPYRDEDIINLFAKNGFVLGRMISASKSRYRDIFPNNNAIFNANIVIKSRGKIWYGDLDLTLESERLQKIATELGEPLYVLREMDARFENEDRPFEFYLMKAANVINPNN